MAGGESCWNRTILMPFWNWPLPRSVGPRAPPTLGSRTHPQHGGKGQAPLDPLWGDAMGCMAPQKAGVFWGLLLAHGSWICSRICQLSPILCMPWAVASHISMAERTSLCSKARFSVQRDELGGSRGRRGSHPPLTKPWAGASSAVQSTRRWAQPAPSGLAGEPWTWDMAEPSTRGCTQRVAFGTSLTLVTAAPQLAIRS